MNNCIATQPAERARTQNRRMLVTIVLLLAILLLVVQHCRAADSGLASCPAQQTNETSARLLKDGNTAFEAGDLRKAEQNWAEIRRCTPGTPDWPKAVFNLGLLEEKRHNFPQAIAYFNEVLHAHPNDQEPGGNLMETNRNYSFRSAMAISECYEAMGAYYSALRYARLAKTKYRYYSWCGTCLEAANSAVNRRIAYLTVRASRVHIWAGILLIGFVGFRRYKAKTRKRLAESVHDKQVEPTA